MIAKKVRQLVPLASGLGLLAVPCFMPDNAILVLVCCGLAALPIVFKG